MLEQRRPGPGQDPGVEPAVGPVHRAGVRQVEHQRPAHHREQQRVARAARHELSLRDRPRRTARSRRTSQGATNAIRPASAATTSAKPSVSHQTTAGRRAPSKPRRNRLASAVRSRPAEPQARARPRVLEAHVERRRPRREPDRGRGTQRIALGFDDAAAAERHRDPTASLGPQLVAPRRRNAQLARPAQHDAAAHGEASELAARELDGCPAPCGPRPESPLVTSAGEPRRSAKGHDQRQRAERLPPERDAERRQAAAAARPTRERRQDREGRRAAARAAARGRRRAGPRRRAASERRRGATRPSVTANAARASSDSRRSKPGHSTVDRPAGRRP